MSKAGILRFFSILAVATLACSLFGTGGGGPSPIPDSKATESSQLATPPAPAGPALEHPLRVLDSAGNPVDIEEPPRDFLSALDEQVEAGDVTEAEVLIYALGSLIGEEPESDLLQGANVEYFEASQLLARARAYLEQEGEGTNKAQVQRLLDAILPPAANLDAYAAAEGDAGPVEPGLSIPSLIRQDEAACRELWLEGFPTDDPASTVCLLYAQFSSHGHDYRIYYSESERGSAGYLTYVRAAEEALQRSIDTYAELSAVDDLSIIFTLIQPAATGPGNIKATVPWEEMSTRSYCPVIIYPSALTESVEWFQQIVAHEIFHCVHAWRVGAANIDDHDLWYAEGMANYFSNVVYPDTNLEHMWQIRFDVNSLELTPFSMSYESSPLFQHLGNEWGNSRVMGIIDLLDPLAGGAFQAGALVGYGLDQEAWQTFGEAYMDNQIMDSGGGPLPRKLLYRQVHKIESSTNLSLEAGVFVLARDLIVYEENTEYEISSEEEGSEGRHEVQRWPQGGGWDPFPESFRSSCGQSGHTLLMTSAEGSSGTYQLAVDIAKGESMECDPCVIGTWEQNQEEAHRILSQIVAGMGTVTSVTGNRYMVITGGAGEAPGRITLFPQDACATFVTDDNVSTACISGVSSSEYYMPEPGRITTFNDNTSFVETITSESGTVTIPLASETLGAGLSWDYQCNEGELTAFTGGAAPFASSTYQRTSPVPTPEPPKEPDVPGGEPGDTGGLEGPPGGVVIDPTCSLLVLSGVSAEGNRARWLLDNGRADPVEISGVSVDWPSANGPLERILVEGTEIWNGSEPLTPAIVSGGWSGEGAARTVEAGGNVSLELEFGSGASPSGYLFVLDFSNGCLASSVE